VASTSSSFRVFTASTSTSFGGFMASTGSGHWNIMDVSLFKDTRRGTHSASILLTILFISVRRALHAAMRLSRSTSILSLREFASYLSWWRIASFNIIRLPLYSTYTRVTRM
jgi:hypothetical protein